MKLISKNKFYIILLIIIIIIIFLYIINNNIYNRDDDYYIENFDTINKKNVDKDIGNEFCKIYLNYGLSLLKKKNYDITNKYKNAYFFKDFPKIKFDNKLYLELKKNNINLEYFKKVKKTSVDFWDIEYWNISDKKRESFWFILKPTINKILKEMFEKNNLKKNIEEPVIHYRCSDVPFIRNNNYHLVKNKFYKDVLDKIQQIHKKKYNNEIKKIRLLYCNSHKSNVKNKKCCDIYLNSLIKYLESFGYTIIEQCNSNIDDFATIFYSPYVITAGSSFSFFSGFFNDGLYFSEGHNLLYNESKKCENCNDWLYKGYSILHSQIKNYYDIEDVLKLLNS